MYFPRIEGAGDWIFGKGADPKRPVTVGELQKFIFRLDDHLDRYMIDLKAMVDHRLDERLKPFEQLEKIGMTDLLREEIFARIEQEQRDLRLRAEARIDQLRAEQEAMNQQYEVLKQEALASFAARAEQTTKAFRRD